MLSPGRDDMITMESLARDLLSLLRTLKWGELSLCSFSMGGMQLHFHAMPSTQLPPSSDQESLLNNYCFCPTTR